MHVPRGGSTAHARSIPYTMHHHEDGEIPWYVGASEETSITTMVDATHGLHSLLGTTTGLENTVTAADGGA